MKLPTYSTFTPHGLKYSITIIFYLYITIITLIGTGILEIGTELVLIAPVLISYSRLSGKVSYSDKTSLPNLPNLA